MNRSKILVLSLFLIVFSITFASCKDNSNQDVSTQKNSGKNNNGVSTQITLEEAEKFINSAEADLEKDSIDVWTLEWIQWTNKTEDNVNNYKDAFASFTNKYRNYYHDSEQYSKLDLPIQLRRKREFLRSQNSFPPPLDEEEAKEYNRIRSFLSETDVQASNCKGIYNTKDCKTKADYYKIIDNSRDPDELLQAWVEWREYPNATKDEYLRFVELVQKGVDELGYDNLAELWSAKYDMSIEEFSSEMNRVWEQIKPLYESLHCHVRAKLSEQYGTEIVALDEPIPAHLTGNMWSEYWINLYDLIGPEQGESQLDLTKLLKDRNYNEKDIVKIGEDFFVSVGFEPLPESFWERSYFVDDESRIVDCKAVAFDIDAPNNDVRTSMCMEVNEYYFKTAHHELGHIFYFLAYKNQPFFFREGANPGFHEAIGDTITLSITPKYLKEINLLDVEPDASTNLEQLTRTALVELVPLPSALIVDIWRTQVFGGKVAPEEYNSSWWELREKYQGVKAPVARSEEGFDVGAHYFVPHNRTYSLYFFAKVLQYQLHEALCKIAGHKGALNECSIYGNKEAGNKFKEMLELGASQNWQDSLELVTGQRELDASALLEYYEPLKVWLDEQNKDRECGW